MIDLVIFDKDPQVSSVLLRMLSGSNGVSPRVMVLWEDVRKHVMRAQGSVVVLGPDATENDLMQAFAVGQDHPQTAFVLVADQLDAATLQQAMRHGIRDVVAVDQAEAELADAVSRAHRIAKVAVTQVPSTTAKANGKVVAVFGAKGGTGKTFVATNLAALMAENEARTVLLDTDLRFGDCSAFLRLRPDKTLADIAGVPGELDESVLVPVLTTHPSGLRVLSAPLDPFSADGIDEHMVTRTIDGLRRLFDLVVVDTGPSFDSHTASVLRAADVAYLVTSLDLPAVKDAKMCLSAMERLHLDPGHVRIIVNRADSKVGFPPEEVGKALQRRVAAGLPSDVSVPRSVNQGVPVYQENGRARISKVLGKLAADLRTELFPEPPAARGRSVFALSSKPRAVES